MSDASTVILAAAATPDRTASAIAKLERIDIAGSERLAVVHSKVELPAGIHSFNCQAGYQPFPELMATLSAWSGRACDEDPTWAGGCALWSLRQAMAKRPNSRLAVLILDRCEDLSQIQVVLDEASTAGVSSAGGLMALDFGDGQVAEALALVEECYASGAAWNEMGDLADLIGAALLAVRRLAVIRSAIDA